MARAKSDASFTIGVLTERSDGNTWLTIVPCASGPSAFTKPAEALFDSVTIWAREPAARSAFMPSMTAVPEPTKITACGSALTIFGMIGPKSGLARSYFS